MNLSRPLEVVTPTVDGDVLTVLASADAAFTPPQVHRVTGRHSESGIRRVLERLADQGIVLRTRAGNAYLYRLNRDHLAAEPIEALADLRARLLARIGDLIGNWALPPEFAAVFGSVAQGVAGLGSDVDIFVVRSDAIDPDDPVWAGQVTGLEEAVHNWTGNDARVLEFSGDQVRRGHERGEPVLEAVRSQGIVVHGPRRYLHRMGEVG